ncbi:MAG: 3-deoxy-7-phosphoheptulonate synthase, partial [Oscillospiraceae bacterium]
MILVLKDNTSSNQIENLISWFHKMGIDTHLSQGKFQTILGLVGDTSSVDISLVEGLDIVETVKRIQEPFKNSNRKFHPDDTIVDVGGAKIGGGFFQIIAGPCSVESEEQICSIAEQVKAAGATLLRGGAFKPRTSPYAFQGLRAEGLELLVKAKQHT